MSLNWSFDDTLGPSADRAAGQRRRAPPNYIWRRLIAQSSDIPAFPASAVAAIPPGEALCFDTAGLGRCDTGLIAFVWDAKQAAQKDRPVTMQMQRGLYDYRGWDPHWGPNICGPTAFGLGAFVSFAPSAVYPGGVEVAEAMQLDVDGGDPHLRDMTAVRGYHIHATDGAIGHVENFLIDDAAWAIRYLIVDARNWWPGQHMLIAPYAVTDINWGDRNVQLNVTCDQVKSSPPWDPGEMIESFYQRRLREHFGW